MRSEEELQQYIRGTEINRELAFIKDEMEIVKDYDRQINLLKWVIGDNDEK